MNAQKTTREHFGITPPYCVDVVAYHEIDHDGLRDHIDTEGREFFRRGSL